MAQEPDHSHANQVANVIINGEANQIVMEVRRAASECQNVVAKLTEREQIEPSRISIFSSSVSEMLIAVVRVRDLLGTTDTRIRRISSTDQELMRLREVSEQIAAAVHKGGFEEEKRLHRELALLTKQAAPKQNRLRADVRSSLVYRLELLRYWWWFVRQAIELYETLSDAIVQSLLELQQVLPEEDELRASIDHVVSNRPPSSNSTSEFTTTKTPENIQAIREEVMQEILLLVDTQRVLDKTREESKELENAEVLLKAEIETQSANGEAGPVTKRDDIDLPSMSSRTGRMAFQDRKKK